MNDQALLKALTEGELLASDTVKQILDEAASTKKSAEQIIYDKNILDQDQVAKVKSKILGVPYKKVNVDDIDAELLKVVTAQTIKRYKMIPLSRSKDMIIVGVVNPNDPGIKEALRFVGKQQKTNIGVYLVAPSDIEAVLAKYSSFGSQIEAALKAVKPVVGGADRRIVKLEPKVSIAEEAPIIKLVSAMLKEAVEANASDLHVEPEQDKLRVRFRITGDLQEVSALPIELHSAIISRIKVLSNLKLDETRIPQDGRFRTMLFDREIDFRVASFPTPFGEKIALRVLDSRVGLRKLEDLGLKGRNREVLDEAISKPYGMVVMTGPTGSGKTTTLYSLLQILNTESVNIVSLEDPVEYSISGVNQSQVKPEIGYSFASGLRQILRQDPDIIMVGEIRDTETAELAIHAALTGHIVLTTLHTNSSIGAIPRLVDLGVQSFLLPSALNLMAAQRLVPGLCQACKDTVDPPPEVLKIIKEEMALLPQSIKSQYKEPYKVYKSEGCPKCRGKGVSGRLAIFEAFKMTPQLSRIISSELNEAKLWEEARRQGIVTLRQDGILKALDGKVAIEQILRETATV